MKAYLVLDFSIRDVAAFMPYVAAIPAFIDKHGGRYVVQGAEPTVVEGDWRPERMVILEFPSREAAQAFLDDPDAKSLFALRHGATDGRLVLVDGCD
ncbi:MAG: DUF1330 domain-containing protein [Gemmatimonadaceae bacterium]|uniref:DUF1330 domain-containing protein n=1 Tax=Caulobacter sp. DWP3-1-3b2 TaxID=2804643 RepID=UPI00198D134E|nr:DUF1330 domain-containing protein [Caulobacter sp.]